MNGVPIARILGFEIRLHLSWLFIVAIVTVTVAGRLSAFQPTSTRRSPGRSGCWARSGSC